jgi:hypothetical protein
LRHEPSYLLHRPACWLFSFSVSVFRRQRHIIEHD